MISRLRVREPVVAAGLVAMFIVGAGTARADEVPFPDEGDVYISGPETPGGIVSVSVKEQPGNPHPTGVKVSSPALATDLAMGDTGRAWVGAAHILPNTEPGTYKVKFTLEYRDAPCWEEEDRDSVCDYEPTVLWSELHVQAPKQRVRGGWGFAPGVASGAAAAGLIGAGLILVRRRRVKASQAS